MTYPFRLVVALLLPLSLATAAVTRALEMMVATQLPNGGWPHLYPERGNYHDYATFNDGGINDCIRVMIEAYLQYEDKEAIEKSLRHAARFMMISQLPPPQPGWAQQYNEFLQPAWARTFEPPSVCPAVTVRNFGTLIDLFITLGDKTLLEPIPDSLRWRRENGKWARFVELGTNRPLYYDRGRIRVESVEELHPERRTGYAYETDLSPQLESATRRYQEALRLGPKGLKEKEQGVPTKDESNQRLQALTSVVQRILAAQEPSGAWITRNDRFKQTMPQGQRWNGEYEVMDRISSAVFNRNVSVLCEYIELSDLEADPAESLPTKTNAQLQGDPVVWKIDSLTSIGGHRTEALGDPMVSRGAPGPAVEFDGIDDGLVVEANPVAGAAEFTIEVVFRPEASSDPANVEQRFIHMQEGEDHRLLIELRLTDDNRWFLDTFIKSGDSSKALYAEDFPHPIGPWYHAALVYKDGEMRHYVNGILEMSGRVDYATVSGGRTSVGVRLNRRSWYKGAIRELRVTPKALTPDAFSTPPEILGHSDEGRGELSRFAMAGPASCFSNPTETLRIATP